jgi:hypothetical protein
LLIRAWTISNGYKILPIDSGFDDIPLAISFENDSLTFGRAALESPYGQKINVYDDSDQGWELLFRDATMYISHHDLFSLFLAHIKAKASHILGEAVLHAVVTWNNGRGKDPLVALLYHS